MTLGVTLFSAAKLSRRTLDTEFGYAEHIFIVMLNVFMFSVKAPFWSPLLTTK